MEDLPGDELSNAIQKKLMVLVSPPDEEEAMSVDNVNPSLRLLEDLGHRKSSKRVAAIRQLSCLIDEGSQVWVDYLVCLKIAQYINNMQWSVHLEQFII